MTRAVVVVDGELLGVSIMESVHEVTIDIFIQEINTDGPSS